jgi:hypothetical protein
MGFELNAFLGRASDLRGWKGLLPSAVVCELSCDLGLVPVTGKLSLELRGHLGEEEANRLDAAQGYSTFPSPSYEEGVRRWGLRASEGTAIAYVSVGEFGNQSHEVATLWADGSEVRSLVNLRAVLAHFRDETGFDLAGC